MACSNVPSPDNWHHIIPEYRPGPKNDNRADYRAFFKELGIDPDDWLVKISHDEHYLQIHSNVFGRGIEDGDEVGQGFGGGAYHELWDTWINEHFDVVDADDVYEFAAQMVEDFGISV